MNYYSLMRDFWDFCYENPEKIKANHCAIFCFIVEHCNRLGWKEKFKLPSQMVMNAVGISSRNTYQKALHDLIDFGFIIMIEPSKNQFSACVIACAIFKQPLVHALDRAIIQQVGEQVSEQMCKQVSEQLYSTIADTDTIIRPLYQYTNKPINQFKTKNQSFIFELKESPSWIESIQMQNKIKESDVKYWLDLFELKLQNELIDKMSKKDLASHFSRWLPIQLEKQAATGMNPVLKKEKIKAFLG